MSILKPYLPKYFSSEWSHSQFRLPAPAPAASRLPFSLSNPTNFPSQAFTSSTSANAAPTIEDDICTCAWINPTEVEGDGLPSQTGELAGSQLVAITRSGGWFRVAFDVEAESSEDRKGKGRAHETAADRSRTAPREGAIGLDKESTSDCRVAEYQRYGQKDGW